MRRLFACGLIGLAFGLSAAAVGQTKPAAVTAQAAVEPDAAALAERARDEVRAGNMKAALALAGKAAEGPDRDRVLTAIIDMQTEFGDLQGALETAARLGDADARARLVADLGRQLATTAPPTPAATSSAAVTIVAPTPGVVDQATVRAVQDRLRQLGFDIGPVDGVAGRRTTDAVRRFQQSAGLPADGAISAPLADALGEAAAGTRYIRFGTEAALIGPPFSNALRGRLRPGDVNKAAAAFSFALDMLGEGETVTWSGTSRGVRGEVRMGARFDRNGQPCRRFRHQIRAGDLTETAAEVVACRDPVQGWQLAR